jgi:hypothetical protein
MTRLALKLCSLFAFILLFCTPALANRTRVTGVSVGSQSATPVYGSSGSVTYTVTLSTSNVAGVQANDDLLLSWGTTPAGVTVTFTPNAGTYTAGTGAYNPATTSSFTLTIAYTSSTVTGSYAFTLTNTEHNGGSTTTANGTFLVNPTTPAVSGGGAGCEGALTLTASGGLPAGGTYNWYNVSTGGTALTTGSTYVPTAPGTYYASYTYAAVEGSRSSGTAVTFTSQAVISTAPTSPTSGLYLSYPFSGNANDVSGNANNGTVQGGASLTTDRYNQSNSAYSFNGSSQYISTTTGEAVPGPQNFSISVWFKTSSAGGMLVGYSASQTGLGGQYDRHIYMDNSGYLYFGIYTTSTSVANVITSTSTYADGSWHHAVATCSATNGSCLYVDGALVASSTSMTTPETYTSVGYWRAGYNNLAGWTNEPTDLYFTGSLDDIAIYNTAISASQVATLYGAAVTTPVCAGSTLSLSVNTVSGATYSWTGPNSFSSSSQNPTVSTTATTAMAGTYTCTVTPSSGCPSTISVTAVVNAGPTSAFTATSSVSIGANATITYSGTYSSTSTYTWNFNGGTIASGSGVGPYTVNWSSSGAKTVTLTVTNAGGCSSTSTQTVTVGSYGNYAFSDPITLNTTLLGITSNLTNFPALLSIQDNNLIISGACADKVYYPSGPNYDFAFYDPTTSSELYYQVESYNQTTGTLLVWVQIPTLTYASNKTIEFYYGSKTPPTTHNTAFFENTWASDYQAVYHFTETAYTGSTTDATANGHTGTANGMSSTNLVTGVIGNAYSFNGSSTSISNSGINLTGTFTISAWVKLSTLNKDQKIMTNQGTAGSSTGGYKLGVYSTNLPETESPTIDRGATPAPSAFTTGTWYYVQGVYNGSSVSTYVNGSQYEITSTTTGPTSTNPFYIGVGEGGSQYYFNGTIDEVRVSNVAKTSDWLKAEYVDQNSPTAFTTVGSTATNSTNAAAISGALTYTWTGATSTDPTVAANWNNTTAGTTSQLPAFDGSAYLIIPSGLTNYPSLTADESLYGLTIGSGASLNLNGHTLSVGCNIYNSSTGQILYGSSTTSGITWNGSASTQTYTGSSTTNTAALGNMTINNTAGGTVTISGGPVDIYGILTITKGNLVVGSSPAALTLKSTATETGSVAAIPTGYSISGTVTSERYITGGNGYRTYRLISSPVYTATVSSNNVYSINYLQTGMYLTGSSGGGFDKTGNPTLYLYREDQTPSNGTFTSGNFWGISAINNSPAYNYYLNGGSTSYNIPVGNGMMFFFRGNRASASLATETLTSYTTPVTVTLSTAGTLTQGQVVVHNWYTPSSANIAYTGSGAGGNHAVRGFNLVGNPYPSSIDWSTFSNTTTTASIYGVNVSPTIWTFDPATKNFATYNATTSISTGNGGKIIASGQGFFVLATAASPSLTFQESAKTSTQVTGGHLLMDKRTALNTLSQGAYNSYMRIKLVADSVNYNDMVIGFNSSSATQFNAAEDSRYVAGMGNMESIAAISSDSIKAAAKWVPLPKNNADQVIRLHAGVAATGQYTLQRTDLKEVPALFEIWLMDRYKKDSLDIKNNATYIFDADLSDTASYGDNRFQIVVRQDPALMVHLLNFTAIKATSGSQVTWVTENEADYTNFTLQRSTDGGTTYTILDGQASSGQGTYSYLDKTPANGSNQYRLQITDLNGNISYSNVVTIMYGNAAPGLVKTGIVAYPNPAKSILNLSIAPGFNINANVSVANPEGSAAYEIHIANIMGSVIKEATITQQNWQTDVSSFMPGTYVIQVVNKNNNTIVGQSTFIKL